MTGAGRAPGAIARAAARRVATAVARRHRDRKLRQFQNRLAGPKILESFVAAYPTAFFVEVGANDGEQHDHLRPILASARWRGIMVEPVPYVFERLRQNYGGRPGLALENAAIAHRDGTLPFYHLRQADDREAAGLPQWYDGIGSFSRDAVLNHAAFVPDLESRLTCIEVPCLTFQSLCRKHDVERVDLLMIDTEGYDDQILVHVDWSVHRPRLVIFEHYHLSDDVRGQLRRMLSDLGYELKEEGFDTWCLHVGVDDALTRTFRSLRPGLRAQSVRDER